MAEVLGELIESRGLSVPNFQLKRCVTLKGVYLEDSKQSRKAAKHIRGNDPTWKPSQAKIKLPLTTGKGKAMQNI